MIFLGENVIINFCLNKSSNKITGEPPVGMVVAEFLFIGLSLSLSGGRRRGVSEEAKWWISGASVSALTPILYHRFQPPKKNGDSKGKNRVVFLRFFLKREKNSTEEYEKKHSGMPCCAWLQWKRGLICSGEETCSRLISMKDDRFFILFSSLDKMPLNAVSPVHFSLLFLFGEQVRWFPSLVGKQVSLNEA